jgi:hypothetical protein
MRNRTPARIMTVMSTVGCLDCDSEVQFPDPPADANCPSWGLGMNLTAKGERGRYPSGKRGALDDGLGAQGPSGYCWGAWLSSP